MTTAENYPELDALMPSLQTAGLTEADGAKLYKAEVGQGFLIECLNAGVTDVEEIILLSDSGSRVYVDRYQEMAGGTLSTGNGQLWLRS